MAAITLDPMEFMQQLEASGMPRSQAEAVVKGYTAMLVHNFDALVTKDYLDTRFSEFESRIELRFAESESRVNIRFAELESKIDVRFARVNVILGILLVGIIIPNLQAVLTWVR